jgi:hypothetical protein
MNQQANQLLVQSQSLVVSTATTRQQAADLWDAIRAFRKQEEANKEAVCRPLKEHWEATKKPYDDFIKKCETAEKKMQAAMAEWDREQDRLARIEQKKIQDKIDAENARKLAKAEAKGQDVAEVVLKVAPVVQAPPKAIQTQAGTVQQRTEKTVYGVKGVVDNEDVNAVDPRLAGLIATYPALFVFDWVAFRKVASTGMLDNVAGVEKRSEYIYGQRSK